MSMIAKNEIKITFDTIFIADKKGRGYIGYLAQYPELFAQGETKQEVEQKLFSSLMDIYEYHKGQSLFNRPASSEVDSVNLVPAFAS